MIQNIKISDYKCLYREDLNFKPLTIITGLNSTGKSSLIQSILLPVKEYGKNRNMLESIMDSAFECIRNKYKNAKEVRIEVQLDHIGINFSIYDGGHEFEYPDDGFPLEMEENLYYLSANRIGAERYSKISPHYKVGINGEYLFGTYETEKSKALVYELIKDDASLTLSNQLKYWLTYITGISTELQTTKSVGNDVEILFKSDDLNNLSPFQLGAGVSYLTKILIMCLRAKKGDVLIIENPEIHLHPDSQAKVGEFLAFIANAGIQLIIETHCEHLIYKVGYEIYKKRFSSDKVVIFYKGGIQTPFEEIQFKENGKFANDFPEGFFDATLTELLEME